jgi:hypothetical protein
MHPPHKYGNANTVTNNHEYYQTLVKNGTANGAASDACLTASYVSVKLEWLHLYEILY